MLFSLGCKITMVWANVKYLLEGIWHPTIMVFFYVSILDRHRAPTQKCKILLSDLTDMHLTLCRGGYGWLGAVHTPDGPMHRIC